MKIPSIALLIAATPLGLLAQSGTLTGAGSTFVNPLMSKWSKEYHTLHPNIQINYQSIGSGGGRQQFLSKTVAFGASDAPLTDEQIAQAGGAANVVHIPVTQGSVVIAYNLPEVKKQLRFSPETIAGMYLGTIKLWNDPKIAADNPGVVVASKTSLGRASIGGIGYDRYFYGLPDQSQRGVEVQGRPRLVRAMADWHRRSGKRGRHESSEEHHGRCWLH